MSRKQKGVKISWQELGRALGGENSMMILPSHSSVREGKENESKEWSRKERWEGPRSENRRLGGQNENLNDFWRTEETGEQQDNWRAGPFVSSNVGLLNDKENCYLISPRGEKDENSLLRRSVRPNGSSKFSQSSSSYNVREPTAFRRRDADVDFSLVREGPRRQTGGNSHLDGGRQYGSRPSSSFRSTAERNSSDDLGCWRQQPTSSVMSKLCENSQDQRVKKYTPPLTRQIPVLQGAKLVDENNLLTRVENKESGTLISSHSVSESLDNNSPLQREDREISQKQLFKVDKPNEIADTSREEIVSSHATHTASSVQPRTLHSVEQKIPETSVGRFDCLNPNSNHANGENLLNEINPQIDTSKPPTVVLPYSHLKPIGTTSVENEAIRTSSTSVKDHMPSGPWRPSHLRAINSTKLNPDNTADIRKKIEELVKTKVLDQEKSTAHKGSTSSDHTTERNDATKEAYKKLLQQKELKKKEEELRKRLEKLESERLEKIAFERLMYGDSKKSMELQTALENGIAQCDANSLLISFTQLLTPEDITSLIPSILIAKCLIRKSLNILIPLIHLENVTDLERMEKVADLVRLLKPVLLYIFNHSQIRRHKLRFLFEIQRFINEMKFPRVSSGLTLIEAIWDALYMEDVVEEQYFLWWYEDTHDETPGRSNMLFQMLGWFNWLTTASVDGQQQDSDSSSFLAEDSDDDQF